MANVKYDWANGAELKKHTQCKLDILKDYFAQYLRVKCSPMVRHFRIAIVDGFAGGGIYQDDIFGSPLIFLQELKDFLQEDNAKRSIQGLPELSIECLFIVNETDPEANEKLYAQLKKFKADSDTLKEKLNLKILKLQKPFIEAYPKIKEILLNKRFQNVLFNIDPCGYSQVNFATLRDIMNSFKNVEIFYTFMIGALLQFASLKQDRIHLIKNNIKKLGFTSEDFFNNKTSWKKSEWLGAAERMIHAEFSNIANFVSPFAINQECSIGYNYWLLHFANNYRAREVYNNVLHNNAKGSAHFGRSGLKMLEYTSEERGKEFNFSGNMREESKKVLDYDIPKFISEFGDGMSVGDFRSAIYNDTPAHSTDINSVLIENPDIEVLTDKERERRSKNSILITDFIRLKKQASFHIYLETKPVSHKKLLESLNATREKDQPVLDYLKDK